jgi:hypothetical protein
MPFNLSDWADVAAIVSAISDVIKTGRETFTLFYNQRRASPQINIQAKVLQTTFQTYSDEEIEAIRKRIENCRDKFIQEGSGKQRAICLCSVLSDVKDGNGGEIPIEDWEDLYAQLCNKSDASNQSKLRNG